MFVRLLPVLVTAVVIYFIKRAWINPVLAGVAALLSVRLLSPGTFSCSSMASLRECSRASSFCHVAWYQHRFFGRTDVALFPGDLWGYDVGYSYLAVVRQAEMH